MPNRRPLAVLGATVIAVIGAVTLNADAEVRHKTPPQAFSSGAMRSELVLREIKEVLLRIDARLANVEQDLALLRKQASEIR